jgi:hypothetical protein
VDHPDQENIQMCGSGLISAGTSSALAQSFVPRLKTISRVEIPLFTIGRPTGLTISIRSDLNGENLASDYLSGENVPENLLWWSVFEFGEVAVTPDETYYIVWEAEGDTNANCFCWDFGYNDPYLKGESWRFQGSWSNPDEEGGFEDIDLCFKTFGPNTPPTMPEITGPQEAETGESHDYIISAADDEEDELVYYIDWGEGEELLYGPYPSGEEQTISHTWMKNGEYTISIKAQDPYNGESDYANLQVKMPKDKLLNNPFMKFLENFPMIYKLLISILE